MNTSAAINAYNKVGVESKVTGADPHKLISMLFEGALLAIAKAKNGIMRNDIPVKSDAIFKASSIINEGLRASLDMKVGGELAQNLAALYEYMITRLVTANMNNDMRILDEVSNLLAGLKDAWDSIRPSAMQSSAAPSRSAGTPESAQGKAYTHG